MVRIAREASGMRLAYLSSCEQAQNANLIMFFLGSFSFRSEGLCLSDMSRFEHLTELTLEQGNGMRRKR